MKHSLPILLVALAAAVGSAKEPPALPHPSFTGDVKPVVFVTDVEKAMPFYRDVLGFDFLGFAGKKDDPYYAEMAAGAQKFGLHEPTTEADAGRVGKVKLYFRVVDLEAQRKRLTLQKIPVGQLYERSWMDFFSVIDPDGNEIVFAVTDPARHTSKPWKRE